MRDANNFIVFVLRDLRTANGALLIGKILADHLLWEVRQLILEIIVLEP